jgi:hypothetical protein
MGLQPSQLESCSQMMPAMPIAGNSKTGPFRPIKKSASDKERAHSAKATLRKSLQKQRAMQRG